MVVDGADELSLFANNISRSCLTFNSRFDHKTFSRRFRGDLCHPLYIRKEGIASFHRAFREGKQG
jgi:hypothetical protein